MRFLPSAVDAFQPLIQYTVPLTSSSPLKSGCFSVLFLSFSKSEPLFILCWYRSLAIFNSFTALFVSDAQRPLLSVGLVHSDNDDTCRHVLCTLLLLVAGDDTRNRS